MSTTIRHYDHATDYEQVNRLLIDSYAPGDRFRNWLQPRWEYMHFHPLIRDVDVSSFGVAEEDGRIVGLVHLEHSPAFVYFQVRPGHEHVKGALLDHAEAHFGGISQTLQRPTIGLYVDENDRKLAAMAAERGYALMPQLVEEHSRILLDHPVPEVSLPPGFRVISLDEENDLEKIDRCLHRGFNHEGEPPPNGPADRAFAQSAPNFRRDLTMVAVSPHGAYVSFGGMWFVRENAVGYVEPVATDPDYRHMGLGRAVVLESVRRVAAAGATVAWVGSSLPFYQALGFTTMFHTDLWLKNL